MTEPQSPAPPAVILTKSRFRNAIGKYRVRRSSACVACGRCVTVCPHGVHHLRNNKPAPPDDYLCVGLDCGKCVAECPQKALTLDVNPLMEVIGDKRWTPDLLVSTWYMAETG